MQPLEIGSVIGGDYLVEAVIGEGGMGVVYRARQNHLDRAVALKVLSDDLSANPTFRDSFLRESKILAGLDHPNIVTVYDGGEDGGTLYLAMAFAKGTDLSTLLAGEGRLKPKTAVQLCGEVAKALDAAHGLGLVHRDVKPGNILVEGPIDAIGSLRGGAQIRLADFGLARASTHSANAKNTFVYVGSPYYSSPEQLRGDAVGPESDVYSLACTLFECIAGRPPLLGVSPLLIMDPDTPPPIPSIESGSRVLDGELGKVFTKALSYSPSERYASCGDFIEAAQGAMARAESAGSGGELPNRTPARKFLPVIAGSVVVALAAAAFAAVLVSHSKPSGTVSTRAGGTGSQLQANPAGGCTFIATPAGAGGGPPTSAKSAPGGSTTLPSQNGVPGPVNPPGAGPGSISTSTAAFLGVVTAPSTSKFAGAQIQAALPMANLLPPTLCPGDVITSVGNIKIIDAPSLAQALTKLAANQAVELKWITPSTSKTHSVEVTLNALPVGDSQGNCAKGC